eukprot:TRINITY_DN7840_c0_g2_i2.p1 TRINITY_DN7840_c0_g2~~TRINITY_DN7840_c0_g2_i2.p1  ORF type:complete len:102 (+),score=20.98 TRINITY_DN7840_c0_g2_i2:182-487(+)
MSMATALLVAGLAVIIHAASATINYRAELKALDVQFSSAPWSVVAECCLGMVLCVLGTAASSSKLLPVYAKRECAQRPFDKSLGVASLMSFNHRARGTAAW